MNSLLMADFQLTYALDITSKLVPWETLTLSPKTETRTGPQKFSYLILVELPHLEVSSIVVKCFTGIGVYLL